MSDKRVKRAGGSRFSAISAAINNEPAPNEAVEAVATEKPSEEIKDIGQELENNSQPQITEPPAIEKIVEKQVYESAPIVEKPAATEKPLEEKEINEKKTNKFDVLKADLCKEDDEISGQLTNLGIYKELYRVLGQIADNAGISLKAFANNVIYDWLINNPEAIQRAKKMAKERSGLAKRFL